MQKELLDKFTTFVKDEYGLTVKSVKSDTPDSFEKFFGDNFSKKTKSHNRGSIECEYCDGAKALVIGKTDDYGIALKYPDILMAYGYDVHGFGSNGLYVHINYCPMCGKEL